MMESEKRMSFNRVGFRTLLGREFHRFLRLYNQTIVPPVLTSLLYILIFGYAMGSKIADMKGFPYIQFMIPGLIMMSVITSSFANTSSSLFIMKFQNSIQELQVSSMSSFEIVFALVLGGVSRGVIVGMLVTSVFALFADFPVMHPFICLYFFVVVATIFSSLGFISAIWAEDFDKLSLFQTYFLTPLIYLGGVFFLAEDLPGFWRTVAHFNPMLYFVNGLRFGFIGFCEVPIFVAAVAALFTAFVLFGVCLRLFSIGYKIKS